jgi:hypothetical protein
MAHDVEDDFNTTISHLIFDVLHTLPDRADYGAPSYSNPMQSQVAPHNEIGSPLLRINTPISPPPTQYNDEQRQAAASSKRRAKLPCSVHSNQ